MAFRVVPDTDEDIEEEEEEEGTDDRHDNVAEQTMVAQLMGETLGWDEQTIKRATASMATTRCTLSLTRRESRRPIVLSSLDKCDLSMESYKGRYFIYLMSLSHPVVSKTDSHIGYSTNPLMDLYCHNHKLMGDRSTCIAAPYWMLDIVIGPFASKKQAVECGRVWVNQTRGKEPKRNKAPFLASISNADMFSFTRECTQSIEDLLIRYADDGVVEIYRALMAEYGVTETHVQHRRV
jgi:hypothetical protein